MEYVPTFNIKNKRMNVGKKNPYMDRMGTIHLFLFSSHVHWIGLREKLQETMVFYHQI